MKGSQALINNPKDITLSDQVSKVSGRAVRSQTIPATKVLTAESQLGSGFHCGSTDAAHLLCTAPLALGALLNNTSTQLFVDVTKAFPSLLRRIVLPGHIESEELWRRHLAGCGMNNEQADAIINMACSVLRWQMAGCTHHNLAMLEAAHLHTWFSLEGLRFIVVFIGGCAAGTPLADLLFIIAMAMLISCMEMDLEAAGLVHHFDATGCAFFFGDDLNGQQEYGCTEACTPLRNVSYVDDVAIPMICDAGVWIDKIQTLVRVVVRAFSRFSLTVNPVLGKTNAIVKPAGDDAAALRKELAQLNNIIECPLEDGSSFSLHIVDFYKHLGAITHATLRLVEEMNARF